MMVLKGFLRTDLADPFEIEIGPVFERNAGDNRRFAIVVDKRHVNMRGVLHGGMLMTFADLALGQAVWDATGRASVVTLSLQGQFLKSAYAGDVVEVLPQIVRKTRALIFARGDFMVGSDVIFVATSTWKVLGQIETPL